MFQTATIGIIVVNDKGVIVKSNPFANRLFGYEEGELEGQKIEALVPDNLKHGHIKHRDRYHKKPIEREMGMGLDLLAKRKDGSTFPVAISLGNTITNGESLTISYINNVTKQKEYEQTIQKEKQLAQTYLDIAGSMVVVLDKKENIQLLNQRGEEILGVKEEEILGLNWFEHFLSEKERNPARSVFQSLMSEKGKDVEYYENLVLNSQQEEKLIWFHNRVLLNKEGQAIGTISSGVDITEQRQAEKLLKESQLKLENYAAVLESKVKERTMKLEESQENLIAALSKEKELGELKSRFVTMASHEFRTPLSSILSSAELLEMYLETGRHEKCEKNINRIKSSVRNLTGILNDFLSLEKLEADKVQILKSAIDLKDYLKELLEEMNPHLKAGQQIHCSYPESAMLQSDIHLLTNILINLLSNAIKYSTNGEDIELSFAEEDQHWLVKVIDQGIGIPEEEQSHMFSRFFRASNVENIQGTGLGLTIVKRYLDLLGGTIGFESEYGKGSTFYFTLPFVI